MANAGKVLKLDDTLLSICNAIGMIGLAAAAAADGLRMVQRGIIAG
jgi:hypothetical protein